MSKLMKNKFGLLLRNVKVLSIWHKTHALLNNYLIVMQANAPIAGNG